MRFQSGRFGLACASTASSGAPSQSFGSISGGIAPPQAAIRSSTVTASGSSPRAIRLAAVV